MTPAVLMLLAARCAPEVAPTTLLALVQAESGGAPWTIGVNGAAPKALRPASRAAAISQANALRSAGVDFDIGLAQINVRNLRLLDLPLERAFDPCANFGAAGRILAQAYRRTDAGGSTLRLNAALSTYNTGDPVRGLRNGYVTRVYRAAAQSVPALVPDAASPSQPDANPVRLHAITPPGETPAQGRRNLDPFDSPNLEVLVWSRSEDAPAPSPVLPLDPPRTGASR